MSATQTAVFPNEIFASPAGGTPETTVVPLVIAAVIPDAPETDAEVAVVGNAAWMVWF